MIKAFTLDQMKGIADFFGLLKKNPREAGAMADRGRVKGIFKLSKFASDEAFRKGEPFSITEFENLLVNTGLAEIWKNVTNQSGTHFGNANAHLGVGDSTTAPATSQTDLQAATNKLRKAMDGGFPNAPVNGLEQWRSTFASGDANFSWQEFAVFNASTSGTMLNRSTSNQGTKASGQTWQLLYSITLS